MKKDKYYNHEEELRHDILPIIRDLKLACYRHGMPMFVSVAYTNAPKKTEYYNDMLLSMVDADLSDDRISTMLLSLNRFDIEPPEYIRKAMSDIREYLDRLEEVGATEEDMLDTKLHGTQMQTLMRIGVGGDTVRYKKAVDEGKVWSGSGKETRGKKKVSSVKKTSVSKKTAPTKKDAVAKKTNEAKSKTPKKEEVKKTEPKKASAKGVAKPAAKKAAKAPKTTTKASVKKTPVPKTTAKKAQTKPVAKKPSVKAAKEKGKASKKA